MQGTEIRTGPNTVRVMPDFIKIHEPKNEDTANINPGVISNVKGGDAAGGAEAEQ